MRTVSRWVAAAGVAAATLAFRPAGAADVASIDMSGTWYKIGRELGSGYEYQLDMVIDGRGAPWFAAGMVGHAPDKYVLVDGAFVHMVEPGDALYLYTETKKGLRAMWGRGDGALGTETVEPLGKYRYYPGRFATAERQSGGMIMTAWAKSHTGRNHYYWQASKPGLQYQGRELFVIDHNDDHELRVGIGWWAGSRLVVTVDSVASRQTSYEQVSVAQGTWAKEVVTTQQNQAIVLGTFEFIAADRMWGTVVQASTQDPIPSLQWIELWSRTPITKADFYAAACAHGSTADCGRP